MPLDISAIQTALCDDGLDGWLLYDFHGSNEIARRLVGLSGTGKMETRRWYYLIPAEGEPRGLVHAIERHNLDTLPGSKQVYADRQQLEVGLRTSIIVSFVVVQMHPIAVDLFTEAVSGTM